MITVHCTQLIQHLKGVESLTNAASGDLYASDPWLQVGVEVMASFP